MAQEKNGPSGMLAAVAHDDITLGWMILRRDEYHVARPKARRQHPSLDGLGRLGGSKCVGGIDLHQSLQHIPRELLIRSRRRHRGGGQPGT